MPSPPFIWCKGERYHCLPRCTLSMYVVELYNSPVTYKRTTARQPRATVLRHRFIRCRTMARTSRGFSPSRAHLTHGYNFFSPFIIPKKYLCIKSCIKSTPEFFDLESPQVGCRVHGLHVPVLLILLLVSIVLTLVQPYG